MSEDLGCELCGKISKPSPVTLSYEDELHLFIPPEATHFVWAYGVPEVWTAYSELDFEDDEELEICFLKKYALPTFFYLA